MATRAFGPSRRPRHASKPNLTGPVGPVEPDLDTPLFAGSARISSLLQVLTPTTDERERERESIELFGFVYPSSPTSPRAASPSKAPHFSRSGVAFAPPAPPISSSLTLARSLSSAGLHSARSPAPRATRRISRLILSGGSGCGLSVRGAAARDHCRRRALFSEGPGAESGVSAACIGFGGGIGTGGRNPPNHFGGVRSGLLGGFACLNRL
ncbi:hypothetical protein ZWY2020_056915 [Hordeum vulgare]|nr:hypothetical protein ZWY2020_056915 [Hordeum vulgare]